MAKIDDFGLFLKSASVLRKLLNRSRFETFLSIKNPKFRKFAENGTFVRRLIASNRSIASYRTISRSKALEKWKIYIYGTSLSDKNWRFWSSLNIVSSAAAAPPPHLFFKFELIYQLIYQLLFLFWGGYWIDMDLKIFLYYLSIFLI